MNYQKKCEHCGNIETTYTYGLNVGKVQALKRLVERYEEKGKPVPLGDLGISNSQYTNFCHLVYFNLAKHIPEGWIPTPEGIKFIYGEIGVMVPAAVLKGKVLDYDHEAWATHPGERSEKFVFDIDNLAYKKRPEYAREKSGRLF